MKIRKRLQVVDKLVPFMTTKKRFKIAIGGRSSGKSHTFALMAAIECAMGHKVACVRQFQNSIKDSVLSLIAKVIKLYDLPGFNVLATEIRHSSGGKIVFLGFQRNTESIKGLDEFKICWVEEAQTLEQSSMQILTPTFRIEGSEIWLTANPQSVEDALSQRFIEIDLPNCDALGIESDDLHMRVKVNFNDNAFFTETAELERQYDAKTMSKALYRHVWLGEYNDSVDSNIILSEWVESAIDCHTKLGWKSEGAIITAHDPANSGDARAVSTRHGHVVIDLDETTKLDINESCTWSMQRARQHGADSYVYDADGCGLGLTAQVAEYWQGSRVNVVAFHGNATVENADKVYQSSNGREVYYRDAFANLRAQKYFELSQRFFKTYQRMEKGEDIHRSELISLPSDLPKLAKLKAELCRIPQIFPASGQFQIMAKKDMMSKLKIKSPNVADCLMMSYVEQRQPRKWDKQLYPDIKFA